MTGVPVRFPGTVTTRLVLGWTLAGGEPFSQVTIDPKNVGRSQARHFANTNLFRPSFHFRGKVCQKHCGRSVRTEPQSMETVLD
jgi:hypothetical protein